MKSFAQLAACGLVLLQTVIAGNTAPSLLQPRGFTRRHLSPDQVEKELGAKLSKGSLVFGPDDPRYANATSRWNHYKPPKIEVVVVPAAEADIPTIVKYSNANSIEWFTINRAHAGTYSVGAFTGLMIDVGELVGLDIQPDKKSVWLQGGVSGGQVINTLWDEGYVATTGSCTCVGMMGLGLGGGHGRYEGLYGLVSDNVINYNVVLADGSAIRVNETSYPDLRWALKGAGHNFAIVTSFELAIHPRGLDTWHYHNYVWKGDKLEEVFTKLNEFHNNGHTPVKMLVNFGNILKNSSVSETEAVIQWGFAYGGSAEEAEKLLQPFNEIEAVHDESGDVPYPEIPRMQGTSVEDPLCYGREQRVLATAGLKVYNLTATRKLYDLHNENIRKYPELADNAVIVQEGYSNEGVKRHSSEGSAFPWRDYNHLNLFQITVPEGSKLADAAQEWGNEIRRIWNEGQPDVAPSAYVNYANGLEPLDWIYGEQWRIDRLIGLKEKYDPHNRFRFFNPIIRD